MIKSLDIRVYEDEKRPSFQFYTGGVEDLYYKNLNKFDTGIVKHINVYFTYKNDLRLIQDGSFVDVDVYFDFVFFEELTNNFQKKRYILDRLQVACLSLSDKFNWESIVFKKTFDRCISENLKYEWKFKNKLFKSPNRKYYFELYSIVDIASFEIYEVLYDSKKNELFRRICFKDKVPIFLIEDAYWDENSLFFYYKFKGPSKIFIVKVEDLINNIQYNLTEETSLFFKK